MTSAPVLILDKHSGDATGTKSTRGSDGVIETLYMFNHKSETALSCDILRPACRGTNCSATDEIFVLFSWLVRITRCCFCNTLPALSCQCRRYHVWICSFHCARKLMCGTEDVWIVPTVWALFQFARNPTPMFYCRKDLHTQLVYMSLHQQLKINFKASNTLMYFLSFTLSVPIRVNTH